MLSTETLGQSLAYQEAQVDGEKGTKPPRQSVSLHQKPQVDGGKGGKPPGQSQRYQEL